MPYVVVGISVHKFGGSILVRASSTLRTIADLQDKTVALTSLLSLGGGQAQWLRLQNEQLRLLADIAQITITGADVLSVEELAEGRVDAAFVKDDIIEVLSALEEGFDTSSYRVLAPLELQTISGQAYPRLSSTSVTTPSMVAMNVTDCIHSSTQNGHLQRWPTQTWWYVHVVVSCYLVLTHGQCCR